MHAMIRGDGTQHSVKFLDLNLLETGEILENMRQEIFIMYEIGHPNIIRLEEAYESKNET